MEESVEADSSAQMEVSSMGSDNMDVESNDCAEGAEESQDLAGVVKVSNISPQANMDQMKKLFGFLGDVQELALYPKGLVTFVGLFLPFLKSFFVSVTFCLHARSKDNKKARETFYRSKSTVVV